MKQKVKILDERNQITRVTEISGIRRGNDLFIAHNDLGQPGEIIEVPEFWVEDFDSDAAKSYMKTKAQYEVTTNKTVLLIQATSHDEAKAIAEKEGHHVLATQHSEYVNDLKIWDEHGYAEACK